MKQAALEKRRTRVQRMTAKRPVVAVEIRRAPKPGARDRFVDLLWELLAPDIHSRTR